MTLRQNTTTSHLISRMRQIWRETDYAQRRLFELQTGISTRARRTTVEELEALYARDERR